MIHGTHAHGGPVQVTLHRLAGLLVHEASVSILVAGRVAVMQAADQVTAATLFPGGQAFQLFHWNKRNKYVHLEISEANNSFEWASASQNRS